jgi:hypothetical protein
MVIPVTLKDQTGNYRKQADLFLFWKIRYSGILVYAALLFAKSR